MIRIILNRTIVRPALVTAFALVSALSAYSQASQTDSQTLQAILAELRGIHNDVRLTAISQILLTELQTQQTVVNQASARVSDIRLQVSNLQVDEKRTAAELAHAEDRVGEITDPSEKAAITGEIDRMKSALAGLKSREEGLNANLQEAEGELRSAQDTLDGIQKDLNATVKRLRPVADNQ
jgi:predicted  nucleic acid-binding Zn-ribbon protein